MTCTRCGNYTLFPPLCAQCEKDDQRARDRAERPAPQESSGDVLKIAAREMGMSVESLSRKVQKGGVSYTYETKVSVTRGGAPDTGAGPRRGLDYDALLRVAHSRDVNAGRLRKAAKALVALAALYWLARAIW